jgi:hypothetical protein
VRQSYGHKNSGISVKSDYSWTDSGGFILCLSICSQDVELGLKSNGHGPHAKIAAFSLGGKTLYGISIQSDTV